MHNLLIKILFIIFVLPSIALGCESTEGVLKFSDLLKVSTRIAASTPSSFVDRNLPGSIVKINGIKYEIRFFSFENISGDLPSNIKFIDYIKNNNLMEMKGTISEPITGLKFHVFDFRKYKLNDGVYFSMALREV